MKYLKVPLLHKLVRMLSFTQKTLKAPLSQGTLIVIITVPDARLIVEQNRGKCGQAAGPQHTKTF